MLHVLAAAVILTITSQAEQAPDWATHFVMQGAYETPQGGVMRSTVQIVNGSGTYTVGSTGARGRFSNAKFLPQFNHRLGPATPSLVGNWELNGQTGYFVFRAPDQNGTINGYWGFGTDASKIVGSWDGILLRPKPDNTPIVPPRPPIIFDTPSSTPSTDFGPLDVRNPIAFQDISALPVGEAAFGEDQAIPTTWLRNGISRCSAVGCLRTTRSATAQIPVNGHIEKRAVPKGGTIGTCFLVAEGVAISAKHIFDWLDDDQCVEIELNAKNAVEGDPPRRYALDGAPILVEPDTAILRLHSIDGDWPHEVIRLTSAIDDKSGFLRPFVYKDALIIYFPHNRPQTMSSRENVLVGFDQKRPLILYTADTSEGASGAPVFNFDWELVGIHFGKDPDKRSHTLPNDKKPRALNAFSRLDSVLATMRRDLPRTAQGQEVLKKLGL